MNAWRYSFYSDAGMGVEPTHDRDGAYVEHEDYAYALHEIDRLEAENAAHKRTEEEWRAAEREWKAKIEKLVAAGDDMRQEWCGHNHGMMGTKAPRSCGRCVVEEAWDRAKGEDEGK